MCAYACTCSDVCSCSEAARKRARLGARMRVHLWAGMNTAASLLSLLGERDGAPVCCKGPGSCMIWYTNMIWYGLTNVPFKRGIHTWYGLESIVLLNESCPKHD